MATYKVYYGEFGVDESDMTIITVDLDEDDIDGYTESELQEKLIEMTEDEVPEDYFYYDYEVEDDEFDLLSMFPNDEDDLDTALEDYQFD